MTDAPSPQPAAAGAWFSAAELERSERYHRRLFRVEALASALVVILLAALGGLERLGVVSLTTGGSTATHAVRLAIVVAVLTVPLGAAVGFWREAFLEPRSAPAVVSHYEHSVPPLPTDRRIIAATVLADELVGGCLAALAVGGAAVGVRWWSEVPTPTRLVVIPVAAAMLWPVVEVAQRLWRQRLDAIAPIADRRSLDRLNELARAAGERSCGGTNGFHHVTWCEGSRRLASSGERAYVQRWGRRTRIVIDRAVLDGPESILQSVVAHELGHLQTIRHGLSGEVHRFAWRAGVAALAGASLAWWTGGRQLDLFDVAVAALVVAAGGPFVAARQRRAERRADHFAAVVLRDRPTSLGPLRDLFAESGTELAPTGLRRLWARYPPPGERLDVLHQAGWLERNSLNV